MDSGRSLRPSVIFSPDLWRFLWGRQGLQRNISRGQWTRVVSMSLSLRCVLRSNELISGGPGRGSGCRHFSVLTEQPKAPTGNVTAGNHHQRNNAGPSQQISVRIQSSVFVFEPSIFRVIPTEWFELLLGWQELVHFVHDFKSHGHSGQAAYRHAHSRNCCNDQSKAHRSILPEVDASKLSSVGSRETARHIRPAAGKRTNVRSGLRRNSFATNSVLGAENSVMLIS